MKKKHLKIWIFILFVLLGLVVSSGAFLFYKYGKIYEKNSQEILKYKKELLQIKKELLEEKVKRSELEKENFNLKSEYQKVQIENKKKDVEIKKLIKNRQEFLNYAKKNNFKLYQGPQRIMADSKYPLIKIPSEYQEYFFIITTKSGDTYLSLLQKAFGKRWKKIKSKTRKELIDFVEKINRVQKNRLKTKMKLVIPWNVNALEFVPFSKKIDEIDWMKIKIERDKKVADYRYGFGSEYWNLYFQNKAKKKWEYYILIDRKKQYFAIYKNKELFYWGPVSTGNSTHITPTGFFINLWAKRDWYSEKYEAEMPNAVNIHPSGFFTHQGPLPGYPASYGCTRMLMKDSDLIYNLALGEVMAFEIK